MARWNSPAGSPPTRRSPWSRPSKSSSSSRTGTWPTRGRSRPCSPARSSAPRTPGRAPAPSRTSARQPGRASSNPVIRSLAAFQEGEQVAEGLAVGVGQRGEQVLGARAGGPRACRRGRRCRARSGAAGWRGGCAGRSRGATSPASSSASTTVVRERGTIPSWSASSVIRSGSSAAGDHAQGALLRRGEAERGQPLGLRAAEPPGQPVQQVSELDRVLVLHAAHFTRSQTHTERGTIVSYTLFELARLIQLLEALFGYRQPAVPNPRVPLRRIVRAVPPVPVEPAVRRPAGRRVVAGLARQPVPDPRDHRRRPAPGADSACWPCWLSA